MLALRALRLLRAGLLGAEAWLARSRDARATPGVQAGEPDAPGAEHSNGLGANGGANALRARLVCTDRECDVEGGGRDGERTWRLERASDSATMEPMDWHGGSVSIWKPRPGGLQWGGGASGGGARVEQGTC